MNPRPSRRYHPSGAGAVQRGCTASPRATARPPGPWRKSRGVLRSRRRRTLPPTACACGCGRFAAARQACAAKDVSEKLRRSHRQRSSLPGPRAARSARGARSPAPLESAARLSPEGQENPLDCRTSSSLVPLTFSTVEGVLETHAELLAHWPPPAASRCVVLQGPVDNHDLGVKPLAAAPKALKGGAALYLSPLRYVPLQHGSGFAPGAGTWAVGPATFKM